jgi:hypothetical protein
MRQALDIVLCNLNSMDNINLQKTNIILSLHDYVTSSEWALH